MNRAFKVEFYGKNGEGKNIFVLSCAVVSGKRFADMDESDKANALEVIETWEKSLQGFKKDLQPAKQFDQRLNIRDRKQASDTPQ